MTKHPTIEQTAHTKIMKLVMDYNAAGRTDVSRLAHHILLTVKDSMDALDMRQERSTPSERLKFEVTDELIAAAAYAMVLLGQKHRAEDRDGPSRRVDAKAALQAVAAIVEARREQGATIPPRLCYWDKAMSCDCITMCDCPHLRLFRLRGQLTEPK